MESGIPVLFQEEGIDYSWQVGIFLEETKFGYLVTQLVVVDPETGKLNYSKYYKLAKRVKLPEYFMKYDCVRKEKHAD